MSELDKLQLLLAALREQTQAIAALSTAGTGGVIFTWLRTYRIIETDTFKGFKRAELLTVPLLLFVSAIVCGYVISAGITGFYLEVATGNVETGEDVTRPVFHYIAEYRQVIDVVAGTQLLTSLLGVVSLAAWYVLNVWASKRAI